MTVDEQVTIEGLRHLDIEPDGPARFDLTAVLAEGRRRKRTRHTRLAGGAAAALLAVSVAVPLGLRQAADRSAAPAGPGAPSGTSAAAGAAMRIPDTPTGCAPELLPVPDGVTASLVTGGDPTGRFLLGKSFPDWNRGRHPILMWDHGRPLAVSMPGDDQRLTDVNSRGVAVGSSWLETGQSPYVYQDGRVRRLLGVSSGGATAINEAGQIVGVRDGRQRRPVIWPSSDQPARDLPLPGPGWLGEATGIDEEGNVVGVLSKGRTQLGFLWPADGGPVRQLPLPTLAGQRATGLYPVSVRSGWVFALADPAAPEGEMLPAHPVRYRLATGEYVPLVGVAGMVNGAGNGRGWVAVTTRDSNAWLVTDDGVVPLPGLAGRTGRTLTDVRALSDDGRVVGGLLDDQPNGAGSPRAVVWRCG